MIVKTKYKVLRITSAIVIVVIIIAAIVLAIEGNISNNKQNINSASNTNKLRVVAGENFWGNIASQVGGKYVHVTSIITNPEIDPHLYESNANNAIAISKADIVIKNGLGYDAFIDKLLNASPNNKRKVLTIADILDVHGHEANPHLWYDIPKIHIVAKKIAASFIKKDSEHKSEYIANVKDFNKSLKPLINQIKKLHGGEPVAYTEPVPGYIINSSGLDNKTPYGFAQAIEDNTQPSPASYIAMKKLMKNKSIKVLFYNTQAKSSLTRDIKNLAKQNGVAIVGVSETMPAKFNSYQSWQKNQLDALQKALANTNK